MARTGEELWNPLTGERIVFLQTAADTGGELLEMDDFWTRPGPRTPAHVHPGMQERWEILMGVARFRIDGVESTADPGELVLVAPGTPHQAWSSGERPVHVRIQMRPALRWEQFVARLFALASEAHCAGASVPDPRALLALLREFPQEIAFAQP